jgi:hypothetical protein
MNPALPAQSPAAFNLRVLALFTTSLVLMFSLSAQAAPPKAGNLGKTSGQPGSVADTPPDMTYFALEGDTLSGIAKRFTDKSSNWAAIGKRNKILNDKTIPVGSAILIPLELLPEEASTATVIALAGQSSARKKDGIESTIAIGDVLNEGTQISTGKNGFLSLELADESRISIPSNSQVLLAKLKMAKYTKSPRTEIRLQQGRVESRVSPLVSNKGRFEVSSPLAIAGVRGTHFRVGINDNGIANEVLSGGVSVGKKEKPNALLLTPGKGNVINASGVGKALDLLAAPEVTGNFRLQEKPTVQFSVTKNAGALAYRAQIASDARAQNILMESRITGDRFKFDGLPDGSYFIKVTAIDVAGLEGLPNIQNFTLKARPEPPFAIEPKVKLRAETVNFVWTEASNALSYRLQVANDAQFQNLVIDQADITTSQYSSSKLSTGNYFWRLASIVKKTGGVDQGPFGDTQTFKLLPAQTMTPLTDTGSNTLSFNWPAEPGQKFVLEIARDPAFASIYLTQQLDQAEISIPRPDAGSYFIRVKAIDPDGYAGAFSATQKIEIFSRWVSGNGEPVNSGSGTIRPSF